MPSITTIELRVSICIIHRSSSLMRYARRRVPQATSSNRLQFEEAQGRS
jgi:hypothetical protein